MNNRHELLAILANGIRESHIIDPTRPSGKKWDDLDLSKEEALHYAKACARRPGAA
jgi:hypothetical protein